VLTALNDPDFVDPERNELPLNRIFDVRVGRRSAAARTTPLRRRDTRAAALR
jgi:hypothetical protein